MAKQPHVYGVGVNSTLPLLISKKYSKYIKTSCLGRKVLISKEHTSSVFTVNKGVLQVTISMVTLIPRQK